MSDVVTTRRESKKEALYAALRASLCDLEHRGVQVFSKSAVIANAKYQNGEKIGETTLYGKTKHGEFVHRAFLLEFDQLIDDANSRANQQQRVKKQKTAVPAKEAIERLRSENNGLRTENDSLLAQLTDFLSSSINANANSTSSTAALKTLETDRYVLSSLLASMLEHPVQEITDNVKTYEMKYAGDARLTHARKRISEIELHIRNSKVTPIFDTMKDKSTSFTHMYSETRKK